MKINRKQIRKMILKEMYGMSSQDMRDSGRLLEELTSKLYSILSGMRMDEGDLNMFARALESSLARAHFDVKGEDQDYQVTISPAGQLTRDFASSRKLSENRDMPRRQRNRVFKISRDSLAYSLDGQPLSGDDVAFINDRAAATSPGRGALNMVTVAQLAKRLGATHILDDNFAEDYESGLYYEMPIDEYIRMQESVYGSMISESYDTIRDRFDPPVPLYYMSPGGSYREVLDPNSLSDHVHFKKYGLHTPEKIKYHSDGAYQLHGMANSTSAEGKGYVWRFIGHSDRSANPAGFYWVDPNRIVSAAEMSPSEG